MLNEGNVNMYKSMVTTQTPPADEDHVLKQKLKLLNSYLMGHKVKINFSAADTKYYLHQILALTYLPFVISM